MCVYFFYSLLIGVILSAVTINEIFSRHISEYKTESDILGFWPVFLLNSHIVFNRFSGDTLEYSMYTI